MHSLIKQKVDKTVYAHLADYLAHDGIIDAHAAKEAAAKALQLHLPLTCYLVKYGLLTSIAILDYCAKKFGLPIFDLDHHTYSLALSSIVKPELIHRYHVIPLNQTEHGLSLGITDPTDHAALTAIAFHTGLSIRPFLVAEDQLDYFINTYYRPNPLESQLESTLSKISFIEEVVNQDYSEQDDEPIIKLVNRLLEDAIEKGISDIHIEPQAKQCRIRFRCDGILSEAALLPTPLAMRIITRLKVMANLNIAERRLPQDGRIYLENAGTLNIRMNSCPSLFGEKLVLRLLNAAHLDLSIDHLGLSTPQKNIFLQALTKPQGLILITGPTGSGKTLTLYSALHYLNQIEKNICTVEDPIEIELKGITQVNVNPKIGLDFAHLLRAFLRQDPDILMVGEIRDAETAHIAIQAAQTGHLVLSTLHTNNAADAILRLQSMGVPAYHLMNTLSLVMAQRLVRTLCVHCKKPNTSIAHLTPLYTETQTPGYHAEGCIHCRFGFKGRTGIFELLPIHKNTASSISNDEDVTSLKEPLQKENYALLWETGMEKVKAGITTYTELLRIVG